MPTHSIARHSNSKAFTQSCNTVSDLLVCCALLYVEH